MTTERVETPQSWSEKFDRWWAESYGMLEQLNNGHTVRIVRRVASLAFMAGAAAERAEHPIVELGAAEMSRWCTCDLITGGNTVARPSCEMHGVKIPTQVFAETLTMFTGTIEARHWLTEERIPGNGDQTWPEHVAAGGSWEDAPKFLHHLLTMEAP